MQAVVFYGACRDLSRIEKRRMRCRGAGIGGVSVLFMTDEKVLFPVRKERSGHGIPPARRHRRRPSTCRNPDPFLLSYHIRTRFARDGSRRCKDFFAFHKNLHDAIGTRVPPKGFSFLRLLFFGMKKRATDGRPSGEKTIIPHGGESGRRVVAPTNRDSKVFARRYER